MLNNSFVEHLTDTIGIRGLTSTPNEDEDVLSPFSPSSWTESRLLRRWFDGITNDSDTPNLTLGSEDEDEDEDDDDEEEVDPNTNADAGKLASENPSWQSTENDVCDLLMDAKALAAAEANVNEDTLGTLYKCPVTMMDGFESFHAIVLSQWDNVLGPQNMHVWTREQIGHPNFFRKLLPFHPICTLNGEISRENVGVETAEYKFYALNEIGFAMGSHIFTSGNGDLYAISLILPTSELSSYFAIQRICINRMRHLINKLQVYLNVKKSTKETISEFTALLKPFLTGISRIGITPAKQCASHIQRTALGYGIAKSFNESFLAVAISVHLESGGVSIVLGDDVDQINMMIDTLALFLHDDECCRSRYADDTIDLEYAPELVLQGIKTDEHGRGFDPAVLIKSTSPSTVIDLKKKTARHARRMGEHQVLHEESDLLEIKNLEAKQQQTHGNPPPSPKHKRGVQRPGQKKEAQPIRKKRFSLVPSTEPAVMVTRLLKQITNDGYNGAMRMALIGQFCLKIARKANVMIQYLKALGASPLNSVPFEQQKTIQKMLELPTDSDFRIILAAAERLQPGTNASMYGDPKAKEENIVNLFGAF